jgi:UPF0271 protein
MGESFGPWSMGNDAAVMPLVDWANIACGGHAGDPDIMVRTLCLARDHGVRAGAHPGYPDPRNFGRIKLNGPVESLVRDVQAQIGALQALATANGVQLHHVKPHGALYNAMMGDDALLIALAEGVAAVDPALVFVLQATPGRAHHEQQLASTGLTLAFEAFADRRYAADGRLASRSTEGSVIDEPNDVEQHVRSILHGTVETVAGPLPIQADTLCIHGDNPQVKDVVERVRTLIPAKG